MKKRNAFAWRTTLIVYTLQDYTGLHTHGHLTKVRNSEIQNWTDWTPLLAMDDLDEEVEVRDDETRWAEGREMALDFMARNFFNQ